MDFTNTEDYKQAKKTIELIKNGHATLYMASKMSGVNHPTLRSYRDGVDMTNASYKAIVGLSRAYKQLEEMWNEK